MIYIPQNPLCSTPFDKIPKPRARKAKFLLGAHFHITASGRNHWSMQRFRVLIFRKGAGRVSSFRPATRCFALLRKVRSSRNGTEVQALFEKDHSRDLFQRRLVDFCFCRKPAAARFFLFCLTAGWDGGQENGRTGVTQGDAVPLNPCSREIFP